MFAVRGMYKHRTSRRPRPAINPVRAILQSSSRRGSAAVQTDTLICICSAPFQPFHLHVKQTSRPPKVSAPLFTAVRIFSWWLIVARSNGSAGVRRGPVLLNPVGFRKTGRLAWPPGEDSILTVEHLKSQFNKQQTQFQQCVNIVININMITLLSSLCSPHTQWKRPLKNKKK